MPYRNSGKNDGNDAEALCEAVCRPNLRFVPLKSVQQQADLSLYRVRQGFVEERTATLNRIRGLIAEFGHVLPNGAEQLRPRKSAMSANASSARSSGTIMARVLAHSTGIVAGNSELRPALRTEKGTPCSSSMEQTARSSASESGVSTLTRLIGAT
jgi:transposase